MLSEIDVLRSLNLSSVSQPCMHQMGIRHIRQGTPCRDMGMVPMFFCGRLARGLCNHMCQRG